MKMLYDFIPCGKGCGYCENLKCVGDDDYICTQTSELLEVKNTPCSYEGVYCMFNYVPYPSDNCPKGKGKG